MHFYLKIVYVYFLVYDSLLALELFIGNSFLFSFVAARSFLWVFEQKTTNTNNSNGVSVIIIDWNHLLLQLVGKSKRTKNNPAILT